MRRIIIALAFLIGSIASASATCTSPAIMHDFPGTAFSMSLGTAADGNCKSFIDEDTASQLHTDLTSPMPAGTNTVGNVNGAPNVTPTDCSGTITTGATAQNAIAAQTTLHGFTIKNIDAAAGSGEPLWFSFTGTATANTAGSYPIAAPSSATTFASGESFTTPMGFGTNHALSVVGATTGHKFSCTWW